jgi:hypothetical protein
MASGDPASYHHLARTPGIIRCPTLFLLLSSLLACIPVWAELKGTSSNTVAVVDFELAGGPRDAKDWGVYLRTGYAQAYDAAVSRLARLRAPSQERP